jgi:hypothetical protein
LRKELSTEIEINAPARDVWAVLTNLAEFGEWNPFIRKAEGVLEVGAKLRVRIEPPEGKAMTFSPEVTRVDPARQIRWMGHFLFPGLFDGEHIFEVSPLADDCTRFIHRERFRGVLVPLLWKSLSTNTRLGFESMNAALKKRVEEQV